jgi:hypothetical protein
MVKFGSLVPFSEEAAAVAKYGADRVMVLRVVAPYKCEVDSDSNLIKRAMRITLAQTKEYSHEKENRRSSTTTPSTQTHSFCFHALAAL